MTKFFDAFISYGRADSKDFALKLQTSLNKHGLEVWFDFNDIPLGVDFQNQIDDGIEKADIFLFVISPHSINSPYCLKEIELAIKCNKRIIPLLHVDEINRETWLSRYPNGSLQDWEAYKTQGKHTSFVNMHPTIGKINWVYFQEDKNDFDKSLADLIDLLGLHRDYVQQHTRFLNKALEWERNQKQTRYLLTGEEKQKAQAWLKIRFKDSQPPCLPSDLHCEYITESIKNGNNLMTQVFLSYAEEDRATMEKIRASLRREGITVWTNTTDIKTGEDFVNSIKQGIEKADNLVYLLSPDAVKSTYTQQELDLAVEFNKRIIPLLVQTTDNLELPSALQDLQYIDLTDNLTEADYQLDESELLKILYEDAAYYNEHKILLTKALKWQQQNHNPSILLRGYNLHSAETWLEVAQKRTQHPPIPLQSEFIAASLQQPPLESLDVFISYSRADSDLARKLNDALQLQGKTTWFDQESIASGSDFQQEINRGIKISDNFVFIISPRSVNSPYCNSEVEYAASLNKRCVTVLHREVNTSDLHPELAKVQWIDFNSNDKDFNANFNQLLRTIETDREHVQNHSKWLQRALEWEQKNKNDDLLLRGSNLIIAQNWLEETEEKKKKPAINFLQKEFIQASQNAIELAEKEEKRRQERMLFLQQEKIAEQKKSAKKQKFFLGAVSIAFLVAVGFGVSAWQERVNAESQTKNALKAKAIAEEQKKNALNAKEKALKAQEDAEKAEKNAEEQKKNAEEQKKKAEAALERQIYSLIRLSSMLYDKNLKFDALIEAIRAGEQILKQGLRPNQETRSLVLTALQAAVYEHGFREQNRLKHQGKVFDVAWSRDGKQIVSASEDGTIKRWNLNGKVIKTIQLSSSDRFYRFSPDGKTIAFTRDQNTVRIFNLQSEKTKTLRKRGSVKNVTWSARRKTIASRYSDNKIVLWNSQGNPLKALTADGENITSFSFSPDGKTIASAIEGDKIKLWNVNNGQVVKAIPEDKNIGKGITVYSGSFSPDGKTIAFASNNNVKLWNIEEEEIITLEHGGFVKSIAWSPDGNTIATSADNTVKIWHTRETQKQPLQTLKGHDASIKSVKFSPDGKKIATASEDNTVRLWSLSNKKLKKFEEDNQALFSSVAWNLKGNTIAAGTADGTIGIWTLKQGKWKLIPTKIKHTDEVFSVSFSPDGKTIASGSYDKTIKLWNKNGQVFKTLKGHDDSVLSVAWSPDGNTIASGSDDETIKLWDKKGQVFKTLKGHDDPVLSVAWSPDGNIIASGSDDKTIKLWNTNGQQLQTLKGHDDPVWSVAWSPDGKTIASASKDTIKLWNLDGEELKTLKGHKNVSSVAFSPNGKIIATASEDGTVKLWWSKDGKEFQTLNPDNKPVTSVSFSKDGKELQTLNANLDGKELQTLNEENKPLSSVSFSSDGKTLISASDYGTLILWDLRELQLDLDQLMKAACLQVKDYLESNAKESEKNLCK